MITRASTNRRARAIAAVALGAIGALSLAPASAAPAPGEVAFVGAYADDGVINAAEAALADPARAVEWTDPGTSVSAEGRFTDGTGTTIPGGNCGPFTLAPSGAGTDGYLNASCMAAALDGEIQWRVKWFDGVVFTAEALDSLIIDRSIGTVAITRPAAGSLQTGTVPFQGTAEPGATVTLFEGASKLKTTSADATGIWNAPVTMTTGTHSVHATVSDTAGNSTTTPDVIFDVDAADPTASVVTPADLSPVGPGGDLILEGTARDTNGQAFGGVLAVEVNVFSVLTPDIRLENLPPDGLPDLLGVVRIGTMIAQDNSDCTPAGPIIKGEKTCSATGAQTVAWEYDASYLPIGVYTFEIRPFDKAGNSPATATRLTIVRL